MRVAILAYEGCIASGVSGFADVLGVANLLAGKALFSTRVLSRGGEPVRAFAGPPVSTDGPLGGPEGDAVWDAVYVPPSFGAGDPPPDLTGWVSRAHASGAVACAACAGVFFLAGAGILSGRTATTHWALAGEFAARHPDVRLEPERLLVDGGDFVCAGGVTACFDLALHIVARFASPDLAASCARSLILDPGRARQTPYMNLAGVLEHGDEAVARAQRWLEENHGGPVVIDRLAAMVNLGGRTLLRRFRKATGRSPGEYLQALRIEHAKRLLESSGEGVEAVMERVGYRDAPAFYRLFKTMTGLTPGEYRRRFRIGGGGR